MSLRESAWEWLIGATGAALLFALGIAAERLTGRPAWVAPFFMLVVPISMVVGLMVAMHWATLYMLLLWPRVYRDSEAEDNAIDNGAVSAITRFALEKHDGPPEAWPSRSRLLLDGEPTGISLPGYELLHQFETPDYYVFVTDHDRPFEEQTNFILVSKCLRVISWRGLWGAYDSIVLQRIRWITERTFVAVIHDEHYLRFTIRSWGIPYLRPRLKMKYLGQLVREGRAESAES